MSFWWRQYLTLPIPKQPSLPLRSCLGRRSLPAPCLCLVRLSTRVGGLSLDRPLRLFSSVCPTEIQCGQYFCTKDMLYWYQLIFTWYMHMPWYSFFSCVCNKHVKTCISWLTNFILYHCFQYWTQLCIGCKWNETFHRSCQQKHYSIHYMLSKCRYMPFERKTYCFVQLHVYMYRSIASSHIVWKYIFIVCYVYKLTKLFSVLRVTKYFWRLWRNSREHVWATFSKKNFFQCKKNKL